MTKNFLLRYRNTSEKIDTIGEHLKIINAKGHTWWGWWKKEVEPDRTEELNEMQTSPNDCKIVLFDRSSDEFYLASLRRVHFSKEDNLVDCPEPDACPQYYKEEKLKAWLDFDKLDKISKEEFLEIFSKIPEQDYTFFSERDLDVAPTLQRIKLKSNLVLQISDIHFGDDHGFALTTQKNNFSLLNTIIDYVEQNGLQIGLLIVSGDITTKADTGVLISTGIQFLNELTKALGLEKEEVVIIPGNHDIPLGNANFFNYGHVVPFMHFLNLFYGCEKELFGLEKFVLPNGVNLDLLRINSVRLRTKEEMNYGYVGWADYKNIVSKQNLDGHLKVAVIHHHLVATPMEEVLDPLYPQGSISVTIDSGRVIEGLQNCGFKFVLNGHQHVPGVTKISRGRIDNRNSMIGLNDDLYVVSAGSAGVKSSRFSNDFRNNSFTTLIVNEDNVEITALSYSPNMGPRWHFNTTIRY